MEFYYGKLKELIKKKKVRVDALAAQIEVGRSTLWNWEKGITTPPERKIRLLAKALNVSVEQISDLRPEIPSLNALPTSEVNALLNSFTCRKIEERKKLHSHHMQILQKQFEEYNKMTSIIETFLDTMEIMFYSKDVSLRYVVANKAFLKNVSLDNDFNVMEREDKIFFPGIEAKENSIEDEQVLLSGKAVTREGYIPGSRRKKWGIISKYPIFDSNRRVMGILGCFTDITERKKAEFLIEQFKKGLEMLDNVFIWMAKEAKDTPEGVRFEKPLYVIKNKFLKEILNIDGDITPDAKMQEYAGSLILDNDKRKKITVDELKKNGKAEVRLKTRIYDNSKIYHIHSKMYYDPVSELYVCITGKDTESERIEKIVEKLRERGVDENIIKEAVGCS